MAAIDSSAICIVRCGCDCFFSLFRPFFKAFALLFVCVFLAVIWHLGILNPDAGAGEDVQERCRKPEMAVKWLDTAELA
jgi:hypothetical protein